MNKVVIAGLVVGVLVAGVIFSPLMSGKFQSQAQAQQAPATGKMKKVLLIASEKVVQVAPDNALHPGGIKYNAMVFNGTIPGPVIAIDQGDTLQLTLKNSGKLVHSIDLHAGYGADKANSGPVLPGQSKTWTLQGIYAGAFFYHCSADALNGIWEHISNGMYGGIIVHPRDEQPAKEFYVVFGENYNTADQGLFKGTNGKIGSFDIAKFINEQPDLILTNGMAHKYVPAVGQVVKLSINKNAEIFKVKPGELTRWYIFDAGPNDNVGFHFIGGIMSVRDGSILNRYGTQDLNDDTWNIPVGSGSVIESTFPSPGLYVGVGHNMNHVLKGGAFAVLAANNSTESDHPIGTWVPPKGSTTTGDTPAGKPYMPAVSAAQKPVMGAPSGTLPGLASGIPS
jgi:nitrite reductase (NO-forming)